jgi:PadR family transcriptional regulator, regulatory protein PadR
MLLAAFLETPTHDFYGYELRQLTGLSTGTMYPLLDRLYREGWLAESWEEIDEQSEGRRRRRYYHLTPLGERLAREAVGAHGSLLRQLRPERAT